MWGIDRLSGSQLSATRRRLRSSKVGVLTHAAAVDRRGAHLLRVLEDLGVRVHVVFTPEHGFDGVQQAEEPVEHRQSSVIWTPEAARQRRRDSQPSPTATIEVGAADDEPDDDSDEQVEPDGAQAAADEALELSDSDLEDIEPDSSAHLLGGDGETEASASIDEDDAEDADADSGAVDLEEDVVARIVSLYGATKQSLTPKNAELADLDVLVIDLVDVGSRYYTYVWTALMAARAAEKQGVHTLILDRPNPISGDASLLEGKPQLPDYLSFVGLESVPARHSMTLGELLAHFFDRDGKSLGKDSALSIATVYGWERHQTARAWKSCFIPPSPNMPSWETALLYPGGCLLEGTNLSEGRGTTLPFQSVGAPFLDAENLADALMDSGLPGVMLRPHAFRPSFGKHAGEVCRGVMLHVTDVRSFRPVTTYLTLITLARTQAPEAFEFIDRPYEFEAERPAFDLLTGSPAAREAIAAGASAEDVVQLAAPVDPEWQDTVARAEDLAQRARA